ncbi:MAG: hypothetical protein WAN60_01235 [Candidatus Sulfotelmatobacter sp.]
MTAALKPVKSLASFAALVVLLLVATPGPAVTWATGVSVQGSGQRPQLFFACCDQGVPAMQALFANPQVISDLEDLHASLALAVPDLSSRRAQTVRQLNAAGIPLVAWIELPKQEGIYLNADDAPQAVAAVAGFEKWSDQYGLHWEGVGLDIEPNFTQLTSLKEHKWRLVSLLAARYFDRARVYRAREAYNHLVRQLQARGYLVQTCQMPFIAAERRENTTLLERLLGVVDVRGDEEVLMLYSSFVPKLGAGMIWALGPDAQAIAIGNTQANPSAGVNPIPLDWKEFSRDMIVASHFSHLVGVYNLEGCVEQGFLGPLKTLNWSQSVLISADMIRQTSRMRMLIDTLLWVGTFLPATAAVIFLMLAGLLWRWRILRKRRKRVLSEVG